MNEKHPYFEYYNRTIQQDRNGLKLVLGGTGLGKTTAIVDVVKHAETDRKFIYCANRIQLLNEMAQKLKQAGLAYVHLKNDTEILLDLFQTHRDREGFYELLESQDIKKYVEHIQRKRGFHLKIPETKRACQIIEESSGIRQSHVLDTLLGTYTSQVMNFFKRILYESSQPDISSNSQLSQRDHGSFLNHGMIRKLFPFVAYKLNEDVKVLLITIQKAFYGFFDGKQNISLTTFQGQENGKNIIFLDEFDFLERDLIDLICQDHQIQEPFKFVEYFYSAMEKNKLPLQEYPADQDIREKIQNIVKHIKELHEEPEKIDFPNTNHFICTQLPQMKQFIQAAYSQRKKSAENPSVSIFHTNRTIANTHLYLKKTERAFELVAEDTGIHAFTLFNTVYWVASNILYLFRELEAKDPIVQAEIMRQCFEATTFPAQIRRIRQLPPRQRKQATHFDKLLDSGFGLYEIQDLQQATDKDEVKLKHYSLHTTPERILRSVAANNIVFGLSATADIPRCLRNFSEDWLKKQEFQWFDIEEDDIRIIQDLNQRKQKQRQNQVTIIQAQDLAHKGLHEFLDTLALHEQGFGGQNKYRINRVKHFFATLLWISEYRDQETLKTDTHLLFFNSYKQIQYLFTHHQGENEDGLFRIERIENDSQGTQRVFQYYTIALEGQAFIIIFYNAEQAKQIEREEAIKQHYHRLFWQGLPVLLVTTYASAGNGVNLQYYPDEQSKLADLTANETTRQIDFKNIHLLDSPYFYFGRVEAEHTEQEHDAIIKQNIWYLAKLHTAKIITEEDFRNRLSNLRDRGLSSWYLSPSPGNPKKTKDAVLNQLATFIQSLGRIERVWQPMEDQVIRMRREVYNVFDTFCNKPAYERIRERRQGIISNNLHSVFQHITKAAEQREKALERYKEEYMAAINQQNKAAIRSLLDKVAAFRQGFHNTSKEDWIALRQAALKHDFQHEKLRGYHCLFETIYYDKGKLYINRDLEIVPHTLWDSAFTPWELDALYAPILKNEIIRRYFEKRGYELGFNNTTNQFFTPYFYQAILAGAIGEEAIQAILRDKGISLADDEIPDALFEIADTKIQGKPYYIDCKNYSEETLKGFELSPADPGWRPKLNSEDFQELAQKKLREIQEVHATKTEKCKLIYLNFIGSDERGKAYYDSQFHDVGNDFQAARFIVIQGVIQQDENGEYNAMNQGFELFLRDLGKEMQT